MADTKLNIIVSAKDRTSGVLGGLSRALGGIGRMAAGAAAAGVGALGAGLAVVVAQAPGLLGVEQAFRGFVGVDADPMLQALQDASNGLITNTDLMKSFNTAAQLVSVDFATTLPDAMGMLGKVAAATGQDMGYMMDSLVRGIGRLSPMILDNLGVQVDLTAANEAYAESIGKTADELTKQEQQTALMAQVMAKLAENTAKLPEVQDPLKNLTTTLTNLKDALVKAIGPTILPMVNDLAASFTAFVQSDQFKQWLETVVDWMNNQLVPAIKATWNWFSVELLPVLKDLAANLRDNVIPSLAILVGNLFSIVSGGKPAAATISNLGDSLIKTLNAANNIIGPLASFMAKASELDRVLRPLYTAALFPINTVVELLWKNFQFANEHFTKMGGILPAIKSAFADIAGAIKSVIDRIVELVTSLSNLELPDWLTPGSPTPFELGLRGIAEAMREIRMPSFNTQMKPAFAMPAPVRTMPAQAAGGSQIINVNVNAGTLLSFADEAALEAKMGKVVRKIVREA